jgi:MscS family membrane protein
MKIQKNLFIILILSLFLLTSIAFAEEAAPEAKGPLKDSTTITAISSQTALSWLPEDIRNILQWEGLGYPLWRLISVIIILGFGFIINKLVSFFMHKYSESLMVKKAKEKRNVFTSTVLTLRRPLRILVWAGIVRLVGFVLTPEHAVAAIWLSDVIINIAVVVFIYDFVEIIEYFILKKVKKTKSKLDEMIIPILKISLRIIVIGLAALQLFQNISGQNITTILAGLGLAGMAVALGAQDTIKNFFGFLMIVLDKPFSIGDRIDFDGHDGVVEEVGLRSTKLRRLDGNLVSIPNMLAADRVIHNIGRRIHIRRTMNIGVTYNTTPEKVEEAIAIVRDVLKDHEGMHPDFPPKVFFNDFTDSTLNIFAIYWYHPPKYWNYLKHSETVNLEILKRFNEAGIEFAFPTRTIQLTQEASREIKSKRKKY